jgi:hypothetical protein
MIKEVIGFRCIMLCDKEKAGLERTLVGTDWITNMEATPIEYRRLPYSN